MLANVTLRMRLTTKSLLTPQTVLVTYDAPGGSKTATSFVISLDDANTLDIGSEAEIVVRPLKLRSMS